MDFDLAEEQRILQSTVERFASLRCTRERVRQAERDGTFPQDLWDEMAGMGLLGLPAPEALGGTGGSMLDMVVVIEALARRMPALAIPFINTVGLTCKLMGALGTDRQRRETLPAMMEGRLKTCFAWTEPSGGSDVLAMRTRAEPTADGRGFVVNGAKTFITLAHRADLMFTMVRSQKDPARKTDGLSCLMIPTGSPGISIRLIDKVGQKSTGFCDVHFEEVFVPRDALVGEENNAWRQVVPLLNGERICFSAVCLGIAEAAFADAREYMGLRSAFGRTIEHYQVLQHHLVDMRAMIDSARLLTWKAAWMDAHGRPAAFEATEALLVAGQMVSKVTDLGMQVMGGYGYTTEFDMERHWRDGRVFRLSPMTTEMARNFLAQGMGMPRPY